MNRTPVQAVFFDAVGTVIHPDPPAATIYAEVGRHYGSRLTAADIAQRFVQAFDRQEQHDRTLGLATSEAREVERWRRIVTDVLVDVTDPEACFQDLFNHFARPAAWRLEPDAGPVVRSLTERGLVLGVASNFDRRLRNVLAGWPEVASLRHLAISSEVGWRKPSPRFFAALAEMTNLPPERILLVGDDRINDYDGATAARMQAVLVTTKCDNGPARIRRLVDLMRGW